MMNDEKGQQQQQQKQEVEHDEDAQRSSILAPHAAHHRLEQARTTGVLPLLQQQQRQHNQSPRLAQQHNDDDDANRVVSNETIKNAILPTNNDENDLMASLLPPSVDNNMITTTTTTTTSSSSTTTHRRLFRPNRLDHHRYDYRHMIRVDSSLRAIRRLGHYLAYFTLLAMLIILPAVLYNALHDRQLDLAAYNSAWVMVCGTIVLSVRLVYLHLTHWYMPAVQKYVVRIVWMVPLYATQSYLSLRFHQARIYIDSVRDFYEAYVIASFVYYLMELLGGQDALVELLRHKATANVAASTTTATTTTTTMNAASDDSTELNPANTTAATTAMFGQHVFPLNLILEPWELGLEFTLQCKHGVLQYVVFKSVATVLTFVCESAGIYGEGKFDWFVAYPYICFLQNLSVMYALYCLVMLYQAIEQELRHPINWRPLGKFLCVKAVVFFCWWQGVLIFYLRAHGIIEALGSWTSEEVANGLIDYCIVIEMVGFAIAHSYTFTYKEYLPHNLPETQSTAANENETLNQLQEENGTALLLPNQQLHHQLDGASTMNNLNHCPATTSGGAPLYRPPATLLRPMKFKDAFWSSTVPKETIQDIQRLRNDFLKSTGNGINGRSNSNRSLHNRGNAEDDHDHHDDTTSTISSSAATVAMQNLSSNSRRRNNKNDDDKSNNDTKEPPPRHSFV